MKKFKVAKKLNMDDYLFHGIEVYFYIGYSSKIEEESEILRTILNSKYTENVEKIMSQSEEKEYIKELKYRILG